MATTTPTPNPFGATSRPNCSTVAALPSLADAKLEISHHIAYYNAERRHSALGYLAPNHFETHLQTTSQLCPA
ncbi:integrase core domain-containing protein [Hymenobacter sp. UYAg731]